MNNQFNIGDIVTHVNPKRENTPWLVVGFSTFKHVKGIGHYYKLVPIDDIQIINPFEIEIEHIHDNYKKVS